MENADAVIFRVGRNQRGFSRHQISPREIVDIIFVPGSRDIQEKYLYFCKYLILSKLKAESLSLWNDFRKVVPFIDENEKWLKPLL